MKSTNRILAFLLTVVMLFTAAMPVSAQEIEPPQEITSVTDGYGYSVNGKQNEGAEPEAATPDSGESDTSGDSDTDGNSEAEPSEENPSLGSSTPGTTDNGAFVLDCTPEQAAELIAFYEFVKEQIAKGNNPRLRAAPGDSGTVSWDWGEAVGIEVPSGDPGNPYYIGNIPKITLSTSNMPLGRPFCVEFGTDPGGSYTASEGSDSQILSLLVAHKEGSASAVGVQLALWYLENGIPLGSHPQVVSALSAASSVNTDGYSYLVWDSGSGQPFVTLDSATIPEEPGDPPDEPGEPENPNTHTEVTTETTTRTEVRSSTEYEYSDAIGQITIAKRDQDAKSLDGAIFKIEIEFANGERGGDSAYEIYNGSRLFTWTHPADDHQPAKVTVTEVRAPDGYVGDFTPQTAFVHPTYTRVTKVLTHTITITTTTTTTSVIDIDSGEVLSESSASADSETELDPPVVQEYTDFVEGDREMTLTFVNTIKAAELVIFKYTTGIGTPLQGAQFEVSYVDPAVHSGRWTVTTGADGKATIALPKPGAILIHEVTPPAGHIISPTYGPDTTVTINAGERKQVDIPNDPYTAVEVMKIDSVTGNPLAGATISLKHVSSGMEFRQVTNSNGIALFENVEPGSWYVEEIKAPDRYVLNTTRYPVQLKSNETATVTIPNDPNTGIEVTKVDANNGLKLAGAYIRLKHISSGQEYSGVTGADGVVYFGLIPPGNYYVEEVQAPHGYVLNDTRYPLELKTGELATLTLPNYRKDGLYIRKVDQDGKPIAGAVFELRRGSGAVLLRDTTDQNGLIYRGFLTTDTYVVEEVQAPEGYLMDENNPQNIFIDETDDNKEYIVTFVNKKKPSIEIIKVDAENPNIRLQGAVFRISEQGGSKTWDVTTGFNGTAVLENLEIGVAYIVEEKTAPSGYVNSGYKEAIVLNECRVHTITVSNGQNPKLRIEKINEATGNKLPGAVFRVAKRGGMEYKDYTTGFDGTVTIEDLEPGWYVITETRAPSGYVLDDTPREIEVVAGETAVITVNNNRKPTLTILKIDEVTKQPLQYARFRISIKEGKTIGEFTTGADGKIYLDNIDPALYVIEETAAPDGYNILDGKKEILLEWGMNAVLEFPNQPVNPLLIKKVDAKTGEALSGAKFIVTKVNGEAVGEFTTGASGYITVTGLQPGWFAVQEIKAPDGYILSGTPKQVELKMNAPAIVEFENSRKSPLQILKIDAATGDPLPGAKFRITTVDGIFIGEYTTDRYGFASADELNAGWYVITETKAPEGYNLENTPRTIEVKADAPTVIEITNTKLSVLQIKKTDAGTGEALSGAHFRVTTTEGTLIGEYITGPDGFINIPDLLPGSYIVSEIKCPEGYRLDTTPKTVVVKPDTTASVEFTNDRLPGLQVQKKDANTGETLSGAKFRVEKANGERVGDFTTNSAGFFVVPDLAPGWYTVYEQKAPAGYITDPTPQNVELKANSTAVVEFENKPLAGLQIKKLDDVTGLPMAGVEFSITELDGRIIGTFITDDTGLLFVPDLQEGWLIVTETKTLPGYKLDSAPRNVEIKSDRLNVLEYRNQPYPFLQIKKVDSETGKAIPGVTFKVYDKTTRELGEFTTNEFGIIKLTGMEAGTYFIREGKAAEGYVLDDSLKEVTVYWGKTTEITVKNIPMGTLRLKKVDSITGLSLPGAGFILYDAKNNIVGEYVSDENGMIVFPRSLPAGDYKVKEIKAPDGYALLDKPVSITLKAGETKEVIIPNEPVRGKIQIVKKTDADNTVTKAKAGATLAGAVFEVVGEKLELVDTITTDSRGIAETKDLPLGKYAIREIKAPDFYVLDDSVFYAEVKLHGDVVRFEVLNTPADINVTVEKRGNVEALTGDLIRYDFFNISNASNISLDEFYLHDELPTDAVRLETLVTGTWSERLKYKVVYRTNLKKEYRTWKDGLLTTVNNELSVSDLKLAANEFITDFKLEFGTVEPGFHEVEAPYILTRVLDDLPNEHRIVNKADIGGKCGDEFVYNVDSWVTIALSLPKGPLPRTGYGASDSLPLLDSSLFRLYSVASSSVVRRIFTAAQSGQTSTSPARSKQNRHLLQM